MTLRCRRRPNSRTPWTRSPATSSPWAIIIFPCKSWPISRTRFAGKASAPAAVSRRSTISIALARSYLADTGMLVTREATWRSEPPSGTTAGVIFRSAAQGTYYFQKLRSDGAFSQLSRSVARTAIIGETR